MQEMVKIRNEYTKAVFVMGEWIRGDSCTWTKKSGDINPGI